MEERITRYLQSKNETVETLKVTALSGGASTDTVLTDVKWVVDGVERTDGLVFKIHRDAGVLGEAADQVKEFNVMKALGPTPVKAPKTYWVEDDPEWFGAPFFVMEKCAGTASTSDFLGDNVGEAARLRACRELAEQIALLHAVDPDQEILRRHMTWPETAKDCALNEIALYENLYREYAVYPDPAVEVVLEWLKANAPEEVVKKSIVWGDPGPGNFMHDGNHVTGLIDWEMSHIGDPMEDVALTLNKLFLSAKIMSTDELFDFYEQAAGYPVDENVDLRGVLVDELAALSANGEAISEADATQMHDEIAKCAYDVLKRDYELVADLAEFQDALRPSASSPMTPFE